MKKLRKLSIGAVVIGVAFAMSSCGGGEAVEVSTETVPQSPTGSTLQVNGEYLTCAELIGMQQGANCPEDEQWVFDTYRQNIDTYAKSGNLGVLNTGVHYGTVAYAGIEACVYMRAGYDRFAYARSLENDAILSEIARRAGTGGVSYFPAWSEAERSLCPGLGGSSSGYQSHDLIIP